MKIKKNLAGLKQCSKERAKLETNPTELPCALKQ